MKDVEIFPSSWYYNACVQGFLEILAYGMGVGGDRIIEKEILQDDGRAVIPGDLAEAIFSTSTVPMPARYPQYREVPEDVADMKRIAWWWVEYGYNLGYMRKDDREKRLSSTEKVETVSRSVFHKSGHYPNLAQLSWDTARKVSFLDNWFSHEDATRSSLECSFCGHTTSLQAGERVYDAFFTRPMSILLGSGPAVFPNLFWNGNPNLLVCKYCRSYFLCFHIVHRYRFFVNSDSLTLNWHLNRLLTGKTKKQGASRYTLLLDALRYDPQLRTGVGGWGLQNLEVLVFDRGEVRYHPVSPRLARLFIVPRVSSLISRIANPRIWEIVLEERFDYLLTVIYKSVRVLISGENRNQDPEVVVRAGSKDGEPVANLIEFYAEVKKHLKSQGGGRNVSTLDMWRIRNEAKNAPLSLDDNLVFRLLELTRLNKKADVYHLLLRTYVVKNVPFPSTLAELFSVEDIDLFKSGVYAYISGLKTGNQEN